MHVVCVQRCGAEQRRLVRTNALDASAGDSPLASHSSIAFPDALGAFPSLSSGYNLAFRVFTSRSTLQASPPPLDSCADMDVHKEGSVSGADAFASYCVPVSGLVEASSKKTTNRNDVGAERADSLI
jgi:hypothetical protein